MRRVVAEGLELAFVGKAVGALAAFGVGRSVGCQTPIRAQTSLLPRFGAVAVEK